MTRRYFTNARKMRRSKMYDNSKTYKSKKNVTHIIEKGEIYQKPKSLVVWEGRPDFSFLFKSCEIDRSQGRLVKLRGK